MPHLKTDDGIKLYYEETGKGIPIVFIHEFAGDYRSYEQQVRHFAKYYRCMTFNARGYPPSDVPKDGERYSQERARDDIRSVLDALKIEKAHIVGLSMGGFAALILALPIRNVVARWWSPVAAMVRRRTSAPNLPKKPKLQPSALRI